LPLDLRQRHFEHLLPFHTESSSALQRLDPTARV